MAVSTTTFGRFGLHLVRGEINYLGDTIKVALTPPGWVFDRDNDEVITDIDQVASGNGYTTGGATLQSKTATYDTSLDLTLLKASNTSWSTGNGNTLQARGAVIYKLGNTPSTSWLMSFVDFGETIIASSSEFIIAWDTNGLITI